MQPPHYTAILNTVSRIYGLPVKDITGPRSLSNIAYARRCACYYMATIGGMNNGQIAKVLNRSMSYVSTVRANFDTLYKYDRWETERVNGVMTALTGRVAA